MWVVPRTMGPFWLETILRHLIVRDTKMGPSFLGATHVASVPWVMRELRVRLLSCPGMEILPNTFLDTGSSCGFSGVEQFWPPTLKISSRGQRLPTTLFERKVNIR